MNYAWGIKLGEYRPSRTKKPCKSQGYAHGCLVTGQIEPTIKYEVILGLQPREKAALFEDQNNIIFSRRIYTKIEFSSQRREINSFVLLDTSMAAVTSQCV